MPRGFFIALEGIDGSGKSTAAALLVQSLRRTGRRVPARAGFAVHLVKFPRHGHPSAWAVDQYLNGRFGDAEALGPYVPGIFYALDRFAAAPEIRKALNRGDIVIADRYVGSNLGHQGGKITNPSKLRRYIRWMEHLEYEIFGIPRPDVTIVLDVPPRIAEGLIAKKRQRHYIRRGTRDAHERNHQHLARAAETYHTLARRPGYVLIDCAPNGKLLSKEEVREKILKVVEQRLQK
jgi:dTMP kinase